MSVSSADIIAAVHLELHDPNRDPSTDFRPSELKIGTPVSPVMRER